MLLDKDCMIIAEPPDFDRLIVSLSLRRGGRRCPLLLKCAPPGEPEGTSGPQGESGGDPHLQPTQTDMVAHLDGVREDPEPGLILGTPLSILREVKAEVGDGGAQMSRIPPNCPRRPGLLPFALGHHRGMTKMVLSALSCAEPGPPLSSERAILASTCPQVSSIPGLPSVRGAKRSDQRGWDRRALWTKPSQGEEAFWSLMKDCSDASANVVQIMVALLPACPRVARYPGFPSACQPKSSGCPSMAGLLPTCPTQTAVAGLPFRAKAALPFDHWHRLQKSLIDKPVRGHPVLADEYPFCQSMVDFPLACPRRSEVVGLPSKEFLSYQNKSVDARLVENAWDRGGITDSDQGQMSPMVAMLPSCPVGTSLLGMPSRPHKLLTHTGQVWVGRVEAQRPDPGPQVVYENGDRRDVGREPERPDETKPVVFQPRTENDPETLRDMTVMSSSCPKDAVVVGLPSAPRREGHMVDLLPSCPGRTQTFGLPSKVPQASGACEDWLMSTKTLQPRPCILRAVRLPNAQCLVGDAVQAMAESRLSCPMVARVPGLPSALTLTDDPKMVNWSPGLTGESPVPGMLLGSHTDQIKLTMERKSLVRPQEKSTGQGTVRVSMLPRCPNHSEDSPHLPGLHLAGVALKTGRVLGVDALTGLPGTEVDLRHHTPVPEGPEDVPKKNAASARPFETSVRVGQTDRPSPTKRGFWMSKEEVEDAAAVGRG